MNERDPGWTPGVRFPAGAGNFYFHRRVQTGSGTQPASYPMGNRVAGALSLRENGLNVKLTIHLHLMPRLGMRRALPPFHHTSSCCDASLSRGRLHGVVLC